MSLHTRKLVLITVWFFTSPLFSAQKSFPLNATPEEFAKWQTETRALLSDLLFNGVPPEEVPFEATFGKSEMRENYELTELSFFDRAGHRTTGLLARPLKPGGEKLPLVIACHGHDGDAYDVFDPESMYFYGDYLAKKGYIVFAPNIEHEYLEGITKTIHWGLLPKKVNFPWMGQRVWMVKRAIDFLLTQPGIDPEKIGIVGLSNGSMTSMFASAFDPRIKLTVCSGSLIMYERMWHRELIHCRCQYIPRMEGVLDYYDVFALIAPRALVIQNGLKDPIFPIHSAVKAFTFIRRAYVIAGAQDQVILDVHEGAHQFQMDVPSAWFAQVLPIPEQSRPVR